MGKSIKELIDSKEIKNDFIKNVFSEFITKHTELFGNVVSQEMLIERLDKNIDTIVLEDPSKSVTPDAVGQYIGFNDNKIIMYFDEAHLENAQLRNDFKGILLHELTHASYTIKNNDVYKSETHIFGTTEETLDKKAILTSGNSTFKEPIVNFISEKIHGESTGAYIVSTR